MIDGIRVGDPLQDGLQGLHLLLGGGQSSDSAEAALTESPSLALGKREDAPLDLRCKAGQSQDLVQPLPTDPYLSSKGALGRGKAEIEEGLVPQGKHNPLEAVGSLGFRPVRRVD